MTTGLMTLASAGTAWSGLVFAQFPGTTKNFWTDLIIMAAVIGGAVYVVCRSSRRY